MRHAPLFARSPSARHAPFVPLASFAVCRLLALLGALALVAFARPARAYPSGADEARVEDLLLDGDLDVEDVAHAAAVGRHRTVARGGAAETWISLVAFSHTDAIGGRELGAMAVVGIAFDRIAQGRTGARPAPSAFAEEPQTAPARAPASDPAAPPASAARPLFDLLLARGAVRAAWRASGIEVTDARIDDLIARSRLSAILPEARLRALRTIQDADHASSAYVTTSGSLVETVGSMLTLEARLTWRLDRLLYADDEATLERLRLERQDARARIGGRTLDLLFAWQRALLDEASSDAGSKAERDAILRGDEAELALDVLTGGWFGAQPIVRSRHEPAAK